MEHDNGALELLVTRAGSCRVCLCGSAHPGRMEGAIGCGRVTNGGE